MLRKRKRRTRRETMASTELIREAKRFCKDLQYLTNERTKKGKKKRKNCKKSILVNFAKKGENSGVFMNKCALHFI